MYGAVPPSAAGQVSCGTQLVPYSARRACGGSGGEVPLYSASVSRDILSTGVKPAVFCVANQVLLLLLQKLRSVVLSDCLCCWNYLLLRHLLQHLGLRRLITFFSRPRPQHHHHACHERTLREQLRLPDDAIVSISLSLPWGDLVHVWACCWSLRLVMPFSFSSHKSPVLRPTAGPTDVSSAKVARRCWHKVWDSSR